jgi:hypothetical protein
MSDSTTCSRPMEGCTHRTEGKCHQLCAMQTSGGTIGKGSFPSGLVDDARESHMYGSGTGLNIHDVLLEDRTDPGDMSQTSRSWPGTARVSTNGRPLRAI